MRRISILEKVFLSFCDIVSPDKCLMCSHFVLSSDSSFFLCSQCFDEKKISPTLIENQEIPLYTLGPYEGFLKKAIHRFKFLPSPQMALPFASELFDAWKGEGFFSRIDCICAVPLSRRRLLERGFDQTKAVAQKFASFLQKPCVSLIKRVQHSTPQMLLTREERLKNLKGHFRRRSRFDFSQFHCVLILDDVMTTGSTLKECSNLFLSAESDHEIIHMVLAKA